MKAKRIGLVCAIVVSLLAASAQPAEAAGDESGISRFRVYFPMYLISGGYLFPVEYFVPHTESPARSAIEALIAGPPDNTGYRFVAIPKTTELLALSIENRICTVDFSDDLRQASVGSGGEAVLISSIVNTLAQFPTVDKVNILIEGQPTETLAGHVDITGPLEPGGQIFRGFEDSSQHWAGGSIMVLQSMDILGGFEDGTSRPDRSLSRAEFVKMLVETLALPDAPDQEVPFSDLDGHWSISHIQRALAAGVISSADYGSAFDPDGVIPREEMAFLLVPARESYAETHRDVAYPAPSDVPAFTDTDSVEPRYLDRVRECAELGLLTGYPGGEFGPKRGLTRGEAATVLARLMGIAGAGTMVVVSSPRPGFRWEDGRFVFLGAASAFEGTVNFRFLDSEREVCFRDYTTSTQGMAFGAVGVSVDTSLFAKDPTLLEVYLVSMEDGSDFRITGVAIEPK